MPRPPRVPPHEFRIAGSEGGGPRSITTHHVTRDIRVRMFASCGRWTRPGAQSTIQMRHRCPDPNQIRRATRQEWEPLFRRWIEVGALVVRCTPR